MTATIGVVILDFNQSMITARCLLSLAQGTRVPDIVVLIENGSEPFPDSYHESLANLNFIKLRPDQNLGCAGGRNLGLNHLIKNSNVTTLIVLDNDTVVPRDFIERVVSLNLTALEVVAPVILNLRTHGIWSCGGIIAPDGAIKQLSLQTNGDPQECAVDWAPGACLIMARQTWEAVGEFDKWMNFLFEDIEWCLRVRNAGGRVIVRTDLQLFHEAHQSLGGRWSQTRVRLWARNGTFFKLTTVKPGPLASARWLLGEALLAVRDLATGRASWSMARLVGLAEGLGESVRRRAKRCP